MQQVLTLCHLVTDTWHHFFYSTIQPLVPWWEQCLNVSGHDLKVWCVPSATYVQCVPSATYVPCVPSATYVSCVPSATYVSCVQSATYVLCVPSATYVSCVLSATYVPCVQGTQNKGSASEHLTPYPCPPFCIFHFYFLFIYLFVFESYLYHSVMLFQLQMIFVTEWYMNMTMCNDYLTLLSQVVDDPVSLSS